MSRSDAIEALADELRDLWLERTRPRLERAREIVANPREVVFVPSPPSDEDRRAAAFGRALVDAEGRKAAELVLDKGLTALATWLVALFPDPEVRARVLTKAEAIVDGWRWEKVIAEIHGWTWGPGQQIPEDSPFLIASRYGVDRAPWPEGFKVEDAPALIDWIRSTLPSGKFARRRAENLLDVVRGMDLPNLELRVPSIGLDDRGRVFDTKTKGLVWAPLSGLAWIWAAYHSTKPRPIYDRATGLFVTDTGKPTVTTISAMTGANLDALRDGRDGSAKAFRDLKAGKATKPEGVRFLIKCGDQQLQLPYVRENEEPIRDASAIFRALHAQPWMGDEGLRDLFAVYLFAHLGAVPAGPAPTFVWYEDEHVDLLGIPSTKVPEVRERLDLLHRTNLVPVGRSSAEAPIVASVRIWRGRGRTQARLLSLAPALYTRTRDADGRTHRNAFPMRASVLRDETPYVLPAAYHSTALISSVWPARPRVERTEDGRPRVRIKAKNLGHRLGLDVRQRRNLAATGTALDRLGEHGFADWTWDGDLTWDSTLTVAPHPEALDEANPRKLRPFEAPEVPRDSKALRSWIKAQGKTTAGLARELGIARPNLQLALREEPDGGTMPLPAEVRRRLRELFEEGS